MTDTTPARFDLAALAAADAAEAETLAAVRHTAYQDVPPSSRGPQPPPAWLITDERAVETDLGVLKTGKEADVHVLRRHVPATGAEHLLAAKRYRSSDHRQFHRDTAYTEGRKVRRSREMRAMRNRTELGKQLLAGQWAQAEFAALCEVWEHGLPVPYPVQIDEQEILMEFLGTPEGVAAPRLAAWHPELADLTVLADDFTSLVVGLAGMGWAHGDLSPYNLLVHEGRLWAIDLPQVVNVAANPKGFEFLERDCQVTANWFGAHGMPVDAEALLSEAAAATLGA